MNFTYNNFTLILDWIGQGLLNFTWPVLCLDALVCFSVGKVDPLDTDLRPQLTSGNYKEKDLHTSKYILLQCNAPTVVHVVVSIGGKLAITLRDLQMTCKQTGFAR